MADYDVFNGDADGICALVQLRRAEPRDATLVTGVKRDVALLQRVKASAGDRITVLDVSMRNNVDALQDNLRAGAEIIYADHHNPGEVPAHERLTALIDTDATMCTSLIVDRHLGGAYHLWAITAAFGDSLPQVAARLCEEAGLGPDETARLERLGTLINYNGYGAQVADLHFAPDALYLNCARHDSPFDFMVEERDVFNALDRGYEDDMARAAAGRIVDETPRGLVLELPDEAASRRVSGVYGNAIAQDHPERAHAILTAKEGGYLVSVRAPVTRREGADRLCLGFETGGGRAGAAGINHLPHEELTRFVDAFRAAF
jgi:hypothetical protein|tara:strand:- start:154344 stop:155297 length:954 start_codon:yes stop_codon:yes gene_type:complete